MLCCVHVWESTLCREEVHARIDLHPSVGGRTSEDTTIKLRTSRRWRDCGFSGSRKGHILLKTRSSVGKDILALSYGDWWLCGRPRPREHHICGCNFAPSLGHQTSSLQGPTTPPAHRSRQSELGLEFLLFTSKGSTIHPSNLHAGRRCGGRPRAQPSPFTWD